MSAEPAAPPAPGAPTAARRGERIHFSRSCGPVTKLGREGEQLRNAMVYGGVMLALLAAWQARFANLATASLVFVTTALAPLATSLWIFVRWRIRTAGLHERPDPSCRLCVVGLPDDLLAFGPLDDASFEPAAFRSLAATPPAMSWIAAPPLVVFLVAAYCLPGLLRPSSLFGAPLMLWAVGSGVATAIAVAWFWPRYYRVLPGRLDLMDYRPLARRGRLVRSVHLRSAKLLIDMRFWTVRIETDGSSEEFLFRFMPDRRRFAHMLLLAAVSTAPAPELPDGDLIG